GRAFGAGAGAGAAAGGGGAAERSASRVLTRSSSARTLLSIGVSMCSLYSMSAMSVKTRGPCETRAMEGYTFSTTVRVRWADTDAQGISHNASYLGWFEVARVEYLREHAGGYQALRDRGFEALVLESFCRYLVPTRFDDVLNVHARCVDV